MANKPILALAVSGRNVFAGTRFSGVFLSTNNGTSWMEANSGLARHPVLTALAVSEGNLLVGTVAYGVFLTSDCGTNWTATGLGGSQRSVGSLVVSDSKTFAANFGRYGNGGIYLSTDAGVSWTFSGVGSNVAASGTHVLSCTWFCIPDGCWGGIRISTNAGTSWDTTSFGYAYGIPRVALIGSNLFVGANEYCWNNQGGSGVFHSTDNGINWIQINSGLTDTNIVSLYASGTNLFAGTGGGLFRSSNNGTSWIPADSGLTSTPVCFAGSDETLFAGTANGVFLSTNGGTRWAPVNVGLTDTAVSHLALGETDLFAVTASSGVWRRPLSEMITGAAPVASELPSAFLLYQNYPNPFNPSTTISYQLSTQTHVMLKVFDVLGREVAILVNEVKQPGRYSVQFDGSGLASGVYFYRLDAGPVNGAGSFTSVRNLLLLR